VLDAFPLPRLKKDALLAFLKTLAEGTRQEALLARISRRGQEGLGLSAAVRETGLKQSVLQTDHRGADSTKTDHPCG